MSTLSNTSQLTRSYGRFPIGPDYVFASLWRHRELVRGLVIRDVAGRYRGSFFGIVWSLIQPLIMLSIYTLVFGTIMQAKWAGSSTSAEFALTLFVGMIVFNFFSECVNRAPSLVLANPNFVKKVVFPLEVFPWVAIGSALFHLAIGVVVWTLFHLFIRGMPPVTLLYLPVVVFPLLFGVLGLAWFLSSIGVFVRDVGQLIGLITMGLLFLSPVFYDISAVPERLQWMFYANPLTFIIQQSRRVMLDGVAPDLAGLALYLALGLLASWLGLIFFQRTRSGFADTI